MMNDLLPQLVVPEGKPGEPDGLSARLTRRDFLRLSAAGVVIIAIQPHSAWAQVQIRSELTGYRGSGYLGAAPLPGQHGGRAAQLRVTGSDLQRTAKPIEPAPRTKDSVLSQIYRAEMAHLDKMYEEIRHDAVVVGLYMAGNFLGVKLVPGFDAVISGTRLGLMFEGAIEDFHVALGEKPSATYVLEKGSDAVGSIEPEKLKTPEKPAHKSNSNAFEKAQFDRDLNDVKQRMGREMAQKTSRDIDREQYRQQAREQRSRVA